VPLGHRKMLDNRVWVHKRERKVRSKGPAIGP